MNRKQARKEAMHIAHTSTHDRYKIGAVITLRSGHSYLGFNQAKSHPLQRKFDVYGTGHAHLHAEIHALSVALRFHGTLDLRGASIYVARVGGGICRPCASCMKALSHFGVSVVHYTDGDWKVERI